MYAVVDGEAIRSQLIDDQVGVPVYLDIQVIDVNTCEPVKDIFLEMWSELPSLLLQMRDIAMECP
jgi:protocatechuate 3,4-dioxygenase beta subunit